MLKASRLFESIVAPWSSDRFFAEAHHHKAEHIKGSDAKWVDLLGIDIDVKYICDLLARAARDPASECECFIYLDQVNAEKEDQRLVGLSSDVGPSSAYQIIKSGGRHPFMLIGLERYDPHLAKFICDFQRDLSDPISPEIGRLPAVIFFHPTGAQGVGYAPHWDNFDAYQLVLSGTKRWSLGETLVPWEYPTGGLCRDGVYRSADGVDIVLRTGERMTDNNTGLRIVEAKQGDLVYCPRGLPHETIGTGEESIALTLAVHRAGSDELVRSGLNRAIEELTLMTKPLSARSSLEEVSSELASAASQLAEKLRGDYAQNLAGVELSVAKALHIKVVSETRPTVIAGGTRVTVSEHHVLRTWEDDNGVFLLVAGEDEIELGTEEASWLTAIVERGPLMLIDLVDARDASALEKCTEFVGSMVSLGVLRVLEQQ